VPGFVHEEEYSLDSSARHGLLLSGSPVIFSSPAIAELDGDSTNGKEIVVSGADGTVYAHRSDGALLWQADVPIKNCRNLSKTNKVLSSPAVGELFGDGEPYVVIGYGGLIGRGCDGGVVAFRGRDGVRRWNFSVSKFAKRQRYWVFRPTIFSTPALADTDGDGTLEIGFGGFDRSIFLLEANGKARWYYQAADTVWSSGAFADVNGDGRLEFIIGTDISANKYLQPPTKDGGYVYAFNTEKTSTKRRSFRDSAAYRWQTYFDQVIYSSPVVADVIPESPGDEVIVASGCFFPQSSSSKRGRWVKVMRARDGEVLRTLSMPACAPSSVAVGDIDEDGILEVVATSNGDPSVGGDGYSRVIAWKATTGEELWSAIPRVRGSNDEFGGNFNSPVIADVDGNGSLEVLVANGAGVVVLAGSSGEHLSCPDSSCEDGRPTLYSWRDLRSTPAVGDANNDGVLDVFIGGTHTAKRKRGFLYGWTNLGDVLSSASGALEPNVAPWPMARGSASRRGVSE